MTGGGTFCRKRAEGQARLAQIRARSQQLKEEEQVALSSMGRGHISG